MEYKIILKTCVAAKIDAIEPKSARESVRRRIAGMIGNPKPNGARAVPGYVDRFRVRMGHYRIVYQVDAARREVIIVAVRNRNRQGQPVASSMFDGTAAVQYTRSVHGPTKW